MSTLGGELGGVEYDFFNVICRAAKHGFLPEEIEKAYRAASSQAFNKPERGRPRGSSQKGKNLEYQLRKMREILIQEPGMRRFTAADQVLKKIPGKESYSSRHLVRTFKNDRKEKTIRAIFLQLQKLIQVMGECIPEDDLSSSHFQRFFAELEILEQQYITTGRVDDVFWSRRLEPIYTQLSHFHRLCAELEILKQQYITTGRVDDVFWSRSLQPICTQLLQAAEQIWPGASVNKK